MIHRNELLFSLASGLAALAAIVAMPNLVAKPKLLFGRSLSAMEPTLFPYITLTLILALSILTAIFALIAARSLSTRASSTAHDLSDNTEPASETPRDESTYTGSTHTGTASPEFALEDKPVFRVAVFFIMLVAYGLLLKPVGFLISSCIVLTVISLLLGNRNWLQIIAFAVLSPVCLYLLATRILLVSLPELDVIELFYAGIINRFSN